MPHESQLGYSGGLTCALQCADLDKSILWYQDVLGFQLLYKIEEMAWAELQTPVERVSLGLAEVEKPQVQGGATLTWDVAEIETARGRLAAQNVRFDGEIQTIPGVVRLATFFDPDGNRHMLSQDLSGEDEPC